MSAPQGAAGPAPPPVPDGPRRGPREMLLLDLGVRDYTEAHAQQLRLHELRVAGQLPDLLLLVEHPHVVTLGRRGTREQVYDRTLPVVEVERGGQATYHGPGQLVAYPIVHLEQAGWGVRGLVDAVGEAASEVLRDLGLQPRAGETKEDIGVWVGKHKLASIGLAVRRNVSFHGVAVNLTTDLSYFARISPCGMDAAVMGSAERSLGRPLDKDAMPRAKQVLAARFAAQLGATPRPVAERDIIARLQC